MSKQRIYASLLILGSGILLSRTLVLLTGDILTMNRIWVSVLLFMEMTIDLGCLVTSLLWFISNDKSREIIPLRFGAAAALFHALRVLVFVIGRTGPWENFDIKPEHWDRYAGTWTWGGVYFAAIMSILGIFGVLIIWRIRVRNRKKN